MPLQHQCYWLTNSSCFSSSRGSSGLSEKKAGAAIGGFGAFTGALLAQISILAGFAGYGLLILGMTGGITFFDES
jgi:hypothetical protein